jgi:hypothetical protein
LKKVEQEPRELEPLQNGPLLTPLSKALHAVVVSWAARTWGYDSGK